MMIGRPPSIMKSIESKDCTFGAVCALPDAVLKPYLQEIFDCLEDGAVYQPGADY